MLIDYVPLRRFYPGFTNPERLMQIQELLRQLDGGSNQVTLKTVACLIESPAQVMLAVDEHRGKRVVGVAVLNFVHLFNGTEARIDEVSIASDYRQFGIDTKLVQQLKASVGLTESPAPAASSL